jgi:hypothetical protein
MAAMMILMLGSNVLGAGQAATFLEAGLIGGAQPTVKHFVPGFSGSNIAKALRTAKVSS